MAKRVGIVQFPGTLDDHDASAAVEHCGGAAETLWHDRATIGSVDAVILPGGFSYGDYLRCGAIAHHSPIMAAIRAFARDGGPVLGICNGFQVLCESGMLPGALLENDQLRFVCRSVPMSVERVDTPWTSSYAQGQQITVPVKHGQGRYFAPEDTLDQLEADGRIVVRYAQGHNPNGSSRDIAGVCSREGNVVGLMPHPEHAVDGTLVGGEDGRGFFESLLAVGVRAV
ncbi:MAG: phosphoribosylformylglycinamidine synthase subunit PurQ [Nitriliruptoraceae bacterium]